LEEEEFSVEEGTDNPTLKTVNAYAIDTGKLNFTNATVTVTAKGNKLWKCQLWNFSTQQCYGTWKKLQSVTPGKEYNITLTPGDPGYIETGVATVNTNKSVYHPGEEVRIFMVVLDTSGYLVSNANVTLDVTNPLGSSTRYSTSTSEITQLSTGVYTTTYQQTSGEGDYSLFVQARGTQVNNSMLSYFTVKQAYDFDIIRTTPVTTDPWKGPFNSSVKIISHTNVTTFSFSEVLPLNFTITGTGGATESIVNNSKMLTWTGVQNNSIITCS